MIIIGHRGAKGLAPENTLASFDKAIACKVDYIEFDVRLTKDKQLVVIHDRHTGRVAFVKKYISRHTLKELRQVVTKDTHPLLTLEEVLLHLAGRTKLHIEIKSHRTAKYVAQVLQPFLDDGRLPTDAVIISSFHLTELIAMHRLNSQLRLAILYKFLPQRFYLAAKIVPLFAVGCRSTLVTPGLARAITARGLFLYVYNTRQPSRVNDPTEVRKLAALGVGGVCTDRPDRVTRTLANH